MDSLLIVHLIRSIMTACARPRFRVLLAHALVRGGPFDDPPSSSSTFVRHAPTGFIYQDF